MNDLNTVLTAYGDAWREPDVGKRRTLLETAWADDGRYVDPNSEAVGRESLIAYISAVHEQFLGSRLEVTSGIDSHHDSFRFGWALQQADGSVIVAGIDFGRVAADGRIAEIVGFFGPLP